MAHPERKHKNIENTYLLHGQSGTLSFKCRNNFKFLWKHETTTFSITFNSFILYITRTKNSNKKYRVAAYR